MVLQDLVLLCAVCWLTLSLAPHVETDDHDDTDNVLPVFQDNGHYA